MENNSPPAETPPPAPTPPAATPPAQPTVETPPSSTLAIIALVLSCLFFVPLAPLVGLTLGIVALVKAKQGGTPRVLAIVAVCLGPLFLFFNLGMCSAIAIPAFMKYIRRSKTVEATMNVRKLADATLAHWQQYGAPPPQGEWTPPTTACGNPGDKFAPSPSLWSVQPWSGLKFSIDDPSYYQYRLVHTDAGAVVVQAQGDLDCDGVLSSFDRLVTAEGVHQLNSTNDIE